MGLALQTEAAADPSLSTSRAIALCMTNYFLLLGQALLAFSLLVVDSEPVQRASFVPTPSNSPLRFESPSRMKRSRSSLPSDVEGPRQSRGKRPGSSKRPARVSAQDSKGTAGGDVSGLPAVVNGDELVSISRQLHDTLKGDVM